MTKVLRGIVHGKTIELENDAGLEDGRSVEVILRAKKLPDPPRGWKPGSNESAGGLMSSIWTQEDDRILQEIYSDRKRESRRSIAE